MATEYVTAALVRRLMNYDPETGALTWRDVRNRKGNRRGVQPVGSAVGARHNGYRRVQLGDRNYLTHRLIWLYVNGVWPAEDVDHIDGVRHNNALVNLRSVSRAVNQQNLKRAKKNTKSGHLGVYRANSKTERWRAQIKPEGAHGTKYLGTYSTREEAHSAYLKAKRELHAGCTI